MLYTFSIILNNGERMNKRIAVFAIEKIKSTSEQDIEDFVILMNHLEKKYNFKWCQTTNSKWVRALADKMEETHDSERGLVN